MNEFIDCYDPTLIDIEFMEGLTNLRLSQRYTDLLTHVIELLNIKLFIFTIVKYFEH